MRGEFDSVHHDARSRPGSNDREHRRRFDLRALLQRIEADFALAGRQREKDLGQDLRVEQRTVQVAMLVVHAEAPA